MRSLARISGEVTHLELSTIPAHFRVADRGGVLTMNTNGKRSGLGDMAGVEFTKPRGRIGQVFTPGAFTNASAFGFGAFIGPTGRKPVTPGPFVEFDGKSFGVPAPFANLALLGKETEKPERINSREVKMLQGIACGF